MGILRIISCFEGILRRAPDGKNLGLYLGFEGGVPAMFVDAIGFAEGAVSAQICARQAYIEIRSPWR